MGQKLFEDKIGALSHSSGSITLAASKITIGGQQYITSALTRAIATDLTMTSNGLYMIYAVVSGGVVDLRFSTNFNSVGPVGFTSWKLVGAFYSDGQTSVGFGSFVTIDGIPTTTSIVTSNLTAAATAGTTTYSSASGTGKLNENNTWEWSRVGSRLIGGCRVYGALTSTGSGSGAYLWPLPAGFSMQSSYHIGSGGAFPHRAIPSGSGRALNNSLSNVWGVTHPMGFDATRFQQFWTANISSQPDLRFVGPGSIGANASGFWDFSFKVDVPIIGWSDTPLKDL